MASRKTIELKFSDDNKSVKCSEVVNEKPNDSFKRMNFGGLIIDVKDAKSRKVTTAKPHREIQPKLSTQPADFACENSAVNDIRPSTSFVIKYPVTPKIPTKPEQLKGNPVQIVTIPTTTRAAENISGAAGLWENNSTSHRTKAEPLKAEPPAVTAEDWKIFKQFMDPLPKAPTYDEIVAERNKPELIKNEDEFVCSICELFISKGKGVVLKSCKHFFCRICLVDIINNNHDAMGSVKCPLPLAGCKSFLDDEEVKSLLGKDFDQFALKIVQLLSNAIQHKERNDEAAKHEAALEAIDCLEFIENVEEFECTVCFTDIDIGQGVKLKNCRHSFCKECLVESIKHSEEYTVKCPGDDCKSTVQEREIRGLLPAELFNQHLEKSLKLYEGARGAAAYHCKTADCPGFVEVGKNLQGFMCFVCKKVNCIGCKVIHHGMNCQDYQDTIVPGGRHRRENEKSENAIKTMVESGEAMYCPQCNIPVMKKDGCDFVTCFTCKLGICWVTRKPRHPLRKEDGSIIDGCHCRENGGPICHPNCRLCH